jgi:hypothetical protein
VGLYNFQARFVEHIRSGRKRHTIRAPRAHPDEPGDVCHLYTGLRRPGAVLLGRHPCAAVSAIYISARGLIDVDGVRLTTAAAEFLAREDGFSDLEDMLKFWRGGGEGLPIGEGGAPLCSRLPFEGFVIHWDPGIDCPGPGEQAGGDRPPGRRKRKRILNVHE